MTMTGTAPATASSSTGCDLPGSDVINALTWRSHGADHPVDLRDVVVPEVLQPAPTLLERAQASGIRVTMTASRYQEHSGLTCAVLRGGCFTAVRALGDLAAAALSTGSNGFCYAYRGDLDLLGHVHGPGSLPWRLQLGTSTSWPPPSPNAWRPAPSWR